jgi:hypothetical protein
MMQFLATLKSFLTGSSKQTIITKPIEGEYEMTKETAKNYTDAQEARLAEFSVITSETAEMLAQEFGKDVKSVRAKAVRMGIYQGKTRVSKTGGPIERKEAIVAEIAALVGHNMDGLEKAPKQALVALRSALSA